MPQNGVIFFQYALLATWMQENTYTPLQMFLKITHKA